MATLREEMRREPRLIDWDYVHRHRNEAPPSEKVHFNFMDGQSGSTTLHLSSYGGDLAMAEWAIESKAEVNTKNTLGRTALHMACEAGSDGVVGYLIQEQADVNAITLSGMTALHFACRESKEMCVRALLHQNLELVDLDVDDADRQTASDLAKGNARILQQIKRYRTSRQQAIKAQFNAKYVKPLFDFYDIDGNGYISREEFFSVQKHFLETLCGETVDMTKLAKQFDEIDADHNRKIDFDEFKAEVERITSASHMTLKELIDALKNVSRSLEVRSLSSVLQFEEGSNLSEDFKAIMDSQLTIEFVTKLKHALRGQDVVLKDGKRGSILVCSNETGSMGIKVHISMNPQWQADLLDAVTPLEDDAMGLSPQATRLTIVK
jgi:hypothetical protein